MATRKKSTTVLQLSEEQKYIISKLRELRENAGFTQEGVAQKLSTSQTMYARYERGANELPIHNLLKLCNLYNVSADYILGLSNKKNPR